MIALPIGGGLAEVSGVVGGNEVVLAGPLLAALGGVIDAARPFRVDVQRHGGEAGRRASSG